MIATKTPAIDKAARIFHFIAGKGSATYSEIHQNVGLPQSTTSALLASLTTHAFLRQKNGRYYLGLIFYELGNKAIQDFDFRELAEESLVFSVTGPVLPAIWAFWMVPPASIWRKKKARMRLSFAAGRENDFPCTVPPLGKCCWRLPEDHIDALLPTEHLPAFTARTITTRKALKAELEVVRLQGWAFDNQEDVDDVTCIAAPVFNSDQAVVAAISISGVRFQMPEEKIPEYANAVMKAAGMMSEKLCGI